MSIPRNMPDWFIILVITYKYAYQLHDQNICFPRNQSFCISSRTSISVKGRRYTVNRGERAKGTRLCPAENIFDPREHRTCAFLSLSLSLFLLCHHREKYSHEREKSGLNNGKQNEKKKDYRAQYIFNRYRLTVKGKCEGNKLY